MTARLLALLVSVPLALAYQPAEARDPRVVREFRKDHPCPSTGKTRGACPGWVVDHVRALACGGYDKTWNLQWQTKPNSLEKDRWERKGCARGRILEPWEWMR